MRIVTFSTQQAALEYADQVGATAHIRVMDDVDAPAGTWWVEAQELDAQQEEDDQ